MTAKSINKLTLISFLFLFILLFLPVLCDCPAVAETTNNNYKLTRVTFDGGGNVSSNGNYRLATVVGQPDAFETEMTGGDYLLVGGFRPGGFICLIDMDDIIRFAAEWLADGSSLQFDLDSSGTVNLIDFNVFAAYWLGSCPDQWP